MFRWRDWLDRIRSRDWLKRFRWRDWLPRAPKLAGLSESLPQRWYHRLSALVLAVLMLGYLGMWIAHETGLLFDPMLQTDDARTSLFTFHRYESGHPLADDPVANEMMSFVTPLVWLVYRVVTPFTGLFWAIKVVQGVCLGIVLFAGWVLLRSRRAGLAAGCLLVFFTLHTHLVMNRIGGGLPRAFAYPCFALWIAGACGGRDRVRFAAVVIAAGTYPSAAVILMAAEGLYLLRDGVRFQPALIGRLKRYGVMLLACAALLVPTSTGHEGGPVYTLAQAEKDPAFGQRGRLKVLPLPTPKSEVVDYLLWPLDKNLTPKDRATPVTVHTYSFIGPFLLFAALVLMAAFRFTPAPQAALSFFAGSMVVYAASIALAFRLYSPDRYLEYGLLACTIALATSAPGLAFHRSKPPLRATVRNLLAIALMSFLVWVTGYASPNESIDIDGRHNGDLYAFAKSLPISARFACHPMDGDDIPMWAARATTGGYETLQPWLVDGWKRAKGRAEDTFRALYTTDRAELLAYTKKYRVSHLLLRPDRYGTDFVNRAAGIFEPLGRFAWDLTRTIPHDRLILASLPPTAIVFRNATYMVVDVAKLEAAWRD